MVVGRTHAKGPASVRDLLLSGPSWARVDQAHGLSLPIFDTRPHEATRGKAGQMPL